MQQTKSRYMGDKSRTGQADDSRINVNESYEMQYWSEKPQVSRDSLKEAAKAAGPLVADIKNT